MLRAATATVGGMDPATPEGPDIISRIEAWVASYLDGPDGPARASGFADWEKHAVELFNRRKGRASFNAPGAESPSAWKRVLVSRKHGATVLRLLDRSLVKESDLGELSDEMTDLVEAGHDRMVLDFGNVERLSCGILPVLAEVSRRCAEAGHGQLRVFNLRPELSPVIGLSPLTRDLTSRAEESAALDGPWPGHDVPRPLPEALLISLLSEKVSVHQPVEEGGQGEMNTNLAATHLEPSLACLVVENGPAKGRSMPIRERAIVIGREPGCQVRSDDAFLSRRHAQVRAVGRRVLLRDLGSTNGTLLNGARLGVEEVDLRPGDRLEIGPLKFRVAADPKSRPRSPGADQIAEWLGPEPDDEAARGDDETAYDLPATTSPLRRQVIEDVLVITPLDPQLLSGSDVTVFRDELAALLAGPVPHRVVVNLKLVARLSNAAIAILVAHHVRLDRIGGALRLCEPHARVAEALNQIRLPLLLDIHATEDEAVISSWERAAV